MRWPSSPSLTSPAAPCSLLPAKDASQTKTRKASVAKSVLTAQHAEWQCRGQYRI
ncbi:hypothetical protein E2C01_076989 [Portunus trituberculatus]|uniref:Uncharacterized protein n=1 Tax=Portunus trituberculatus TaxID=210409 RepID=A0A5B7ID67_PORTR|nr:hypothetical protein [Portunus trituberculatus]